MRIGIDGSNLRAGGGVTHLAELLSAARPLEHRFSGVTVWSCARTLEQLPQDRPWLNLVHEPLLDGSLVQRLYWQNVRLGPAAQQHCDVLLVPGGSYLGSFRPFVTMFRNLLPFEPAERARYWPSFMFAKLIALRFAQAATFRRADGLIFLNDYARTRVMAALGPLACTSRVIPHGVAPRFRRRPRPPRAPDVYSQAHPFRWLYVSTVDSYKHQPEVVRALAVLRNAGLPVALDLVGAAYRPALRRLRSVLKQIDGSGSWVTYHGPVPHLELDEWYRRSDGFIFASTCENMPKVLLEAMAAGLPVACSRAAPLPEMLRDGGIYFDAERSSSIAEALRALFLNPALRDRVSHAAHCRAAEYSWERTAAETFGFLREIQPSRPVR